MHSAVIVVLTLLVAPSTALAEFKICSFSKEPVYVAIVVQADTHLSVLRPVPWQRVGWWKVTGDGPCVEILTPDDLSSTALYLRVQNSMEANYDGGLWELDQDWAGDEYALWVSKEKFCYHPTKEFRVQELSKEALAQCGPGEKLGRFPIRVSFFYQFWGRMTMQINEDRSFRMIHLPPVDEEY
jgi:uncharacterized membrane protein